MTKKKPVKAKKPTLAQICARVQSLEMELAVALHRIEGLSANDHAQTGDMRHLKADFDSLCKTNGQMLQSAIATSGILDGHCEAIAALDRDTYIFPQDGTPRIPIAKQCREEMQVFRMEVERTLSLRADGDNEKHRALDHRLTVLHRSINALEAQNGRIFDRLYALETDIQAFKLECRDAHMTVCDDLDRLERRGPIKRLLAWWRNRKAVAHHPV